MYIPRIIKKEEIEKMSNYELIKLRRQLMSSLRKADEDKIKMQRFMELHPDTLTKQILWVEDEEAIFKDDLKELILVLEEIQKRELDHKWAWEEE